MLKEKVNKMLAWIGTICGIIGSVLVAANNGFQFVGYVSFLIGAMACLYTSIMRKDNSGITLWGFFTAVNIWGLINYV
jgi:hypothetical protein